MTPSMRNKALVIGLLAAGLAGAAIYGYMAVVSKPPEPVLSAAAQHKLKLADFDIVRIETEKNGAPSPVERSLKSAEAWITRGKITADGADFDHAMKILGEAEKQAAAAQKSDQATLLLPDIRAERGRVLRQRHRFLEAQSLAEKALVRNPDHEQLLGIAGDASVQVGDLRNAETYLRRLTVIAPRIPSYWVELAYWAEIAGDLEQSVELLKRAPDAAYPRPVSDERSAYIHTVLADVLAKQGKFDEARQNYEFALAKLTGYAQARSGLADVEQFVGNDPAAEKLLRGLIESEWPNADYKVKLANVRERLNDPADAKALRLDAEKFYEWSVSTGYEGYLRPLATLKLEKGDFAAAARFAARDLALRPNSESRAIYQNVLNQARAAGKSVSARSVRDAVLVASAG